MYIKPRGTRPISLAIMILGALLAGAFADSQEGSDSKVDYAATRNEIQNFEVVVNSAISAMFSSSPFALVQKPKGAYLQGYGVTFNFLVNIHRAVFDTPFGQLRRSSGITPELKKRRIEELKEKLIRVLIENGDSFRQLRQNDVVTIVAFLEDRNFPDEPNENKTIVLTALKKDLEEFARRDDRWKEFKQRMKIIEY